MTVCPWNSVMDHLLIYIYRRLNCDQQLFWQYINVKGTLPPKP